MDTPAGLAPAYGDDSARTRQRRHPRWRLARSPWAAGALLLLFGLACTWVAWCRIPAVARDTFWAEDGAVFIPGAAGHGLGAVLVPYAGYLHVVPRLAATVVTTLPVWWWAIATTAASCAIAGALAVVVFVCSTEVVPWLPARFFIASLTVLAPLGPVEVLGNLANLHWLFLWALFWVVLARPRSQASALALSAIALAGTLTEIQAAIWMPLFLARPRDRRRMLVAAGCGIGLVVQVIATLGSPRTASGHPPLTGLASLGYGFLINAVMPLAIPQTQIGPALIYAGPAPGMIMSTAIVLAVVYIWRRGSRVQFLAATAAVVGSVLIYCADVEVTPNQWYDYAALPPAEMSPARVLRYGVVPSMLLATVIVIAATVCLTRTRTHAWPRWAGAIIFAVGVSLIVAQVGPQPTLRGTGPAFRPQLSHAARTCAAAPFPRQATLREAPGWEVPIPCARLTDSSQTPRT